MNIATPIERESPVSAEELQDLISHSINPAILDDPFDKTCINAIAPCDVAATTPSAQRFGRYEVVRKLGQGGMGAVYLACDTATGQQVALKVLSQGCLQNPEAFQRFEKEARLLEEAQNPHIANMLDLGTEGGTRFLVMEFVDGGDLRRWIAKRGPLDESTALEIVSDLCRALASVHQRGMVHRDIKPENVLISEAELDSRPVIKLTDFGLARHIDQSESLKLTQTGALLGTPYYMAPEQFRGTSEVSAATDVYALGITLFELIAGRRPFQIGDPIKLATAHCFETPPDLRKLAENVSDGTADLVFRMLAKSPTERPADAACLLEEILRLQSGTAAQLVLHPSLPEHDASKVLIANFEWRLESTPEMLWRYVSNTDRFNQAAGIPPVSYEMVRDEAGRTRKFGQFRMAGMIIKWEEHPFEWVEGRRFSILREFPSGPFVWFLSTVALERLPEGGTLLTHHVKILPRGVSGRMLATLEVGVKGKRNLDRIYRRIDATLMAASDRVVDQFQAPKGMSRIQRSRLQRQQDQLKSVGVNDEIIAVLHDLVTNAASQDLAKIRPIAIARRFSLPEREVVDACLHGVRHGLLTMGWDLICPSCRLAADAKQTLREIDQHTNCNACQTDFKVEFGSSIELVFRVHPDIRKADSKLYCNGGPGNFPHVVAQVSLEPGERLLLNLNLEAGSYNLRGARLPYTIPIEVDTRNGVRHGSLRCAPGTLRPVLPTFLGGSQQLVIENSFSEKQLVRIERTVKRSDAITAAEATGMPLFRQFFPGETLAPGQLVQLATTNFLAIQPDHLDDIFAELGDSGAYLLMRDLLQFVQRYFSVRGGSLIDEQGGLLIAIFPDPAVALEAAAGLYTELGAALPQRQWSLSGALHRGTALVTSDRQEINYFGTAVNEAVRQARRAIPGQLLVTNEVASDPGVVAVLAEQLGSDTEAAVITDDSLRQINMNQQRSNLTVLTNQTKGRLP